MTDLCDLDDHDLLLGGVADGLLASQAQARRWARLVEFHRRREADHRARQAADPHFVLTPRQATAVEVSELWGVSEHHARHQLNVALFLSTWMPQVWQWCLHGQLDTYLATTIADQIRHHVTDDLGRREVAERVTAYLTRRLRDHKGIALPIVNCTAKQVRNKLTYEINRVQSPDAERRFRDKYAARAVQTTQPEDGVASLIVTTSVDQVQRADHRLTLAAKELRAGGDERTIEQLKSDLAIDLLTGREAGVPVPSYARPIINVTVPLQTLMGISDDPGTLSGGTVIPAALARKIAAEPGSTWHRMLTDEAGTMTELSTRSYAPTAPIWRQVVAGQGSCYRPNCSRASTGCELDHRQPWPAGATRPSNLQPACKTDHKAKHSAGFSIDQAPDGSFVLRTAAGFRHPLRATEHPTSTYWPEVPEIQFSATEIVTVLAELQQRHDRDTAEKAALDWEHRIARSLDQLLAG